MAKPQQSTEDDVRMPFLAHMRDLRDRLRSAAIAFIGGVMVAYLFKEELFVLTAQPLIAVWQQHQATNPALGNPQFVFNSLTEPFWTYFSVALWGGIFVSAPFVFHQLWKFVAPGLYRNERMYGLIFAIVSAICFIGGATFCYFLVLPQGFDFLLSYATSNVSNIKGNLVDYQLGSEVALMPLLSMQQYVSLSRNIMLGFGLVFELPLLIFFLSLIGLVTHRSLWRFNRWWIVLSFVIGAVLTPTPDVVMQSMMAVPLVLLYQVSIGISWFVTTRREAKEAALIASERGDQSEAPESESTQD